jgi:hypothetical protein
MPIPLPNLDDRRWVDLVDEGQSLIPLYGPEWTNFNPSSPGITLIELLAAVAEKEIYRLNRVTDRSRRKFLELADGSPLGPQAGQCVLGITLASGAPPVDLPAGTTYRFASLLLRTLAKVTVVPGALTPYSGDSLYLGFSDPLPPGAAISLYVQGTTKTGPIYWEYFNGEGWWSSLQVKDSTGDLANDGFLELHGPPSMQLTEPGKTTAPLYYVRARVAGASAPSASSVTLNAVVAEQSEALTAVALGTGTGAPWQTVTLPNAPVLIRDFKLQTAEGAAVDWTLRTSFDSTGPGDPVFLLDGQSGVVTFGDGRKGRVPPNGAAITASYFRTGAAAGFLAAGSTASGTGNLTVATVTATSGGADEETLDQAMARVVSNREAPYRAVTLADYEALAKSTPGTDLARVTALANHHPQFDCVNAFGVVTVMVVPNLPGPAPRPDAALRTRIATYLNDRRMIGTRVEVAGPIYLEVAVQATVQSYTGQDPARVQAAVIAAINALFDPLTGGPDGTGWPFGRDVYRAEVMQTIVATPGVDHVVSLALIPGACSAQCGNVCLKPTWLVTPGQHTIEVL